MSNKKAPSVERAIHAPPPADLVGAIHRLWQIADATLDEASEANGIDITPRQRHVLVTIRDETKRANAPPSQTVLEDASGVDRSTLSDLVRRLMRKGLVTRHRSKEDLRAYRVKLTEAGAEVLRRSDRVARDAQRDMLALGHPVRDALDRVAAFRS